LPHPYIHNEKDNKNVWQQIYDQSGKTKEHRHSGATIAENLCGWQ
jgi:hypothetical protein